jgi:hypothetical protein
VLQWSADAKHHKFAFSTTSEDDQDFAITGANMEVVIVQAERTTSELTHFLTSKKLLWQTYQSHQQLQNSSSSATITNGLRLHVQVQLPKPTHT